MCVLVGIFLRLELGQIISKNSKGIFFFFPTRSLTVIVSGGWCCSCIHPLIPGTVNPANERKHSILHANTELIHLSAKPGLISI